MYSLTFCVRVVARTPPVEARIPGRRSNVENAPRRRQVTASQPRALLIYGAQFWERPSHRPAARADPAERSHYVVISQDGHKLVTRVRVMLP